MSVQDRLAAAQDKEMGQWLLSLLTPSQFIELFPDYYRRSLPDISGFIKAIPSSMSAAKQAAMEEQLQNTASGSAAGANMRAGGWRKKWQEGINRATPTRAGVVPPPQLSPEQRKVFDELRSAPMALDDPRAKMFTGLSDQQLSSAGIERYKEGGKEFFRYTAPTVSEEEAKKAISQQGNFEQRASTFLPRLQKDLGITREQAAGIIGSLGGETGGLKAIQEAKPMIPGSRGGFGWAQWTGPRRREFEAFAASKGLDITSDEANYQFLVKELQTSENKALQQLKRTSTVEEAARTFTGSAASGVGYLRPGIEHYGSSIRYAQRAYGAMDGITADYSQKSIELARERLIRQIEDKRISSLAEFTSAQLPSPGSVEANAMVGDTKNATAVAERIKSEFGHLSNPQCVALAKAYVGASGSVTDWRRGTNALDGTLRPGTPIATFMDRSGNPSTLYDGGQGVGAPGNHTTHAAVFLDYVRDGTGKITGIKVMEQYAGSGGAKEKIYPVGGSGTGNAANYYSINDTKGVPLGPNNPMLQTMPSETPVTARDADKPPVPTPAQPAPSVETPRVMNKPGAAPQEAPQAAPGIPAPTPAAPAPSVETPQVVNKSSAVKYKFNEAAFVAEVRAKETGAFFVSDDYILNELRKGFKDTPGVSYKNGVLTVDDPKSPAIQQVLNDMKTHNFDSTKFMNQIKEEKKTEVKPVEQKPVDKPSTTTPTQPTSSTDKPKVEVKETPKVDKPSSTSPAQPAPSVETPKVENKTLEPPKEAPAKVKTNAAGGDNRVNTEQISAYPIGGLKGDNVVVVNKQQQPLFTMNTNESITMNPKTDTATVTPSGKERNVGAAPKDSFVSDMFGDFNQSVRELASKFDQNKPVPERQDRPDTFTPEGGNWLNNLNKLTEKEFHSPSARRAFYRAGGSETGEPHSGFHFSHGNRS